jgi:hypothetical protein
VDLAENDASSREAVVVTVRCELYDAGTKMVKLPSESPPGMDLAYYRELDMEYDFRDEATRRVEIREDLIANELRTTLRPWPESFPAVMWIDQNERHYGEDGGPQFKLYHYDPYTGSMDDEVPSFISEIADPTGLEPFVNRKDERMGVKLSPEEAAEGQQDPTKWIRLPTKNESQGTQLGLPSILMQRGHVGASFALEGNYSPFFMPFDLRRPEYYRMLDQNGDPVDDTAKKYHMRLMADGKYRLYLAPAKWRWVATVVAIYVYISWFEAFYTKQIFTQAWYNRPPIYPIRHNALVTSQSVGATYDGGGYSVDNGITDGFDRSRGSAFLRQQIIDAQWYTMSEAYVYTNNDPVTLVLWQQPPEPGDVVLGIGSVDYPSTQEELLWLIQDQDVSARWPNTVIGHYLVPFYVTI